MSCKIAPVIGDNSPAPILDFRKSRIDYYGGMVKTFQRGDVDQFGTLVKVTLKMI
jgi:hypothetical protein